jgi:GSCFA family
MNFSTKVPITPYQHSIDYQSKIISFGSCFAENMGEKLDFFKFQNAVNPFGIIFNPVSIEKLIDIAVNQKFFTEADVFFHNELWHSFDVHSELSNPDKDEFLKELNLKIQQSKNLINQASHIIITYGTSWVYRHNPTNEIVANCHKVNQKEFTKEILSPEIIQQSIQNTIALIEKVNPNCRFIFTVSPVRHIKDGFAENQRSKAHLIAALHQLLEVPPSGAEGAYFPSYEIMMDELRDYRFYSEDMLHPSQMAIDYIWERFFENYISSDSFSTMQEVSTIQKGLAHRPFNPETDNHKLFLKSLNDKIIKLQEQFSHFQF